MGNSYRTYSILIKGWPFFKPFNQILIKLSFLKLSNYRNFFNLLFSSRYVRILLLKRLGVIHPEGKACTAYCHTA